MDTDVLDCYLVRYLCLRKPFQGTRTIKIGNDVSDNFAHQLFIYYSVIGFYVDRYRLFLVIIEHFVNMAQW